MDQHLRRLERDWQSSNDPTVLDRFLSELLRVTSLEDWEIAAEEGNTQALEYLPLLRNFVDNDIMQGDIFINVYEDFTARSSVSVSVSDITVVRKWLRDYYTLNPLFYSGREVYDVSLQRDVDDPAAKIVIENSAGPCFRFYPGEIAKVATQANLDEEELDNPATIRQLSPINRWGQRDHFVSFRLIEDFSEPAAEEAEIGEPTEEVVILPHWVNAYSVSQAYGGSQEGGWYFYVSDPIASVYVGHLPATRMDDHERSVYLAARDGHSVNSYMEEYSVPSHLLAAVSFMGEFYNDINRGDIHSVNGGSELDIRIQTHPAIRDPFYWPHYE